MLTWTYVSIYVSSLRYAGNTVVGWDVTGQCLPVFSD